jgi:hypothetical protein
MQGYSKSRFGPSVTVHYNSQVDNSKQVCSKRGLGPSLTVHYNGYVEAYK